VACSVSDVAGHPQSASDTVKLDGAGPSITASHTADGSGGWNVASPVTETVGASDTSGTGLAGAPTCTVDAAPATLSGSGPWTFPVSTAGTHAVSCSVTDVAGHVNSGSDTVKIDSAGPSIASSHTSGSGGWNGTSPVTETVTASDTSGMGLAGNPTC